MASEMSSSKYNLIWQGYRDTVSSSFGSLRTEAELCDIRLVSEEEEPVLAHKVVLSTCSKFFKALLGKLPGPNAVAYLGGVSTKHLQYVLDYIYLGEVNIAIEDVDEFLAHAKKFKLPAFEGHTESDTTKEDHTLIVRPKDENVEEESTEECGKDEDNNDEELEDADYVQVRKEEIEDSLPSNIDNMEEESQNKDDINNSTKELHAGRQKGRSNKKKRYKSRKDSEQIKEPNLKGKYFLKRSLIMKINGEIIDWNQLTSYHDDLIQEDNNIFNCKACTYSREKRSPMKSHVECHIDGLEISCNLCEKKFNTRNILFGHMNRSHRNEKLKC